MAYVRVEIDIDDVMDDVLEHASVADLKAEIERRRSDVNDVDPRDVVQTAIAQIRRGDTLDAITTLEREFWPKWASVADSEAALRKAKAANDNQEAAPAVSEGGWA